MKLRIAKAPLRKALGWMRRFFFLAGVSLLSYCAYVLVDAWGFQAEEHRQFDRLVAVRQASTGFSSPTAAGGLIGRIEIARLGFSAVVVEGTGAATLRRAVGHIEGTALPGQAGNVGLSGHRDTFFRPLRNIRQNDTIMVTTLQGQYRYRVLSTKVVRPSDVAVLDSTGSEILTLVTCYPFYFVGPAPSRFVVRAERVS
jgi:sortase A